MNSSDADVGPRNQGPLDDLEDQLQAVETEVRRVPSKDQVDRVERRSLSWSKMAVIASLIITIISAGVTTWLTIQVAQNTAQQAITQEGVESLKSANEQLRRKGLPEIPLPSAGDRIDPNDLAAAAAAILRADIQNDPSFKGAPGDQGAACTPQIPGCTGEEGKAGSEGPRGPDGASGPEPSDERIANGVSAYCSADPTRCIGPKGDPGDPGAKGDTGPAPESITFTYLLTTYTCTDPEKDGHYDCDPMP